MYLEVKPNIKKCEMATEDFQITIGLHHGSAPSPILFTMVLDEMTQLIQGEVPWYRLYPDDIVLEDETREWVNAKLERWKQELELLSRSKTEYIKGNSTNELTRGNIK